MVGPLARQFQSGNDRARLLRNAAIALAIAVGVFVSMEAFDASPSDQGQWSRQQTAQSATLAVARHDDADGAAGRRIDMQTVPRDVQLCQALGPAAPYCIRGVDSMAYCGKGEPGWDAWGPIAWQTYAQGEYVGPARSAHVGSYRIRVDDVLDFVYRLSREELRQAYKLQIGDTLQFEVDDEADLTRTLTVQPDGTVTLPLMGQLRVVGRTIAAIQADLVEKYASLIRDPKVTVTPATNEYATLGSPRCS